VNGVDIIGQIHNISIINENGNQWMVISDKNSKQEGFGYIFKRIKDWLGDWVWFLIKRVIWVLLAILFLYVSVKLLIIWCKYRSKRKNKSLVVEYRKSQDEELVEIKPSNKNKKRLETSEYLINRVIWVLLAILFLYVSVKLLIIWCKYRSKRKNKSQVVVKYRKSQDEELVEIKPSKKNKKRLETSEALSRTKSKSIQVLTL
jgi:membrane protein implicated in regulation of membrane protease activity